MRRWAVTIGAAMIAAQGQAQRKQRKPTVWIGGWNAAAGVRPLGAPTGITVDSAGRLWVVEDRNRTVLMLIAVDERLTRGIARLAVQA